MLQDVFRQRQDAMAAQHKEGSHRVAVVDKVEQGGEVGT